MNFEIVFKCEYCGEELGTRVEDNVFYHDEFHECFGETVGFLAEVGERKVITRGVDVVLDTPSE